MKNSICIGSTRHIDWLHEKLNAPEIQLLQQEFSVELQVDHIGDFSFLLCQASGNNDHKSIQETETNFRKYVARVLALLIVERWEQQLLNNIIKNSFYYFNEEERKQIFSRASEIVDELERENLPDKRRLEYITNRIAGYLEEEVQEDTMLIVEGFLRFRLKDYVAQLEEGVDQAVDEYLMEKEYHEFIRLLKYFVDIQEPRVEKVHVVLRPSGVFQLFDGDENIIDNEYLEGFVVDLVDSEINYEDLLISALITIAPRKVILHFSDHSNLHSTVNTIKNVFLERVTTCPGCAKCLHSHQKKY
ncbi:MAG: putative sporulation protein YtxC [Bacillota bacterium]